MVGGGQGIKSLLLLEANREETLPRCVGFYEFLEEMGFLPCCSGRGSNFWPWSGPISPVDGRRQRTGELAGENDVNDDVVNEDGTTVAGDLIVSRLQGKKWISKTVL